MTEELEIKIPEILFGNVDLTDLRKWRGTFEISKEKYLEILGEKENIFCIEFCSGCGRILPMNKELAEKYYNELFSFQKHSFLDQLVKINKSSQFIHTKVCNNCSLDLANLQQENRYLEVDPIPKIQKI